MLQQAASAPWLVLGSGARLADAVLLMCKSLHFRLFMGFLSFPIDSLFLT